MKFKTVEQANTDLDKSIGGFNLYLVEEIGVDPRDLSRIVIELKKVLEAVRDYLFAQINETSVEVDEGGGGKTKSKTGPRPKKNERASLSHDGVKGPRAE